MVDIFTNPNLFVTSTYLLGACNLLEQIEMGKRLSEDQEARLMKIGKLFIAVDWRNPRWKDERYNTIENCVEATEARPYFFDTILKKQWERAPQHVYDRIYDFMIGGGRDSLNPVDLVMAKELMEDMSRNMLLSYPQGNC